MRLLDFYRRGGLDEVRRAVSDWIRYRAQKIRNDPYNLYREPINYAGRYLPGESVWGKEWDILCILDGCRSDTYEEYRGHDIETIRSVGSTSHTWIPRTIDSDLTDLSSVAYISGNPHSNLGDVDDLGYYHLEPVVEMHGSKTVPPKPLTDRAISAWRRREELGIEKMIVHYMQPHVPFRSQPEWFSEFSGNTWGSRIWKSVGDEFSKTEFLDAYRDNLAWVFGSEGVELLAENAKAEIAISADHGNAIGEFGFYGHPKGCPVSAVRDVPWETIEGSDSETHVPDVEPPQTDADLDEQLEALGYL